MRISPSEIRLLIYKKMKLKGLSYSEAKKEIDKEQRHLETLTKQIKAEKKKPAFKEAFNELTHEKTKTN